MIADEWGAQRYGLIAIEAWNEPNLRPFWGVRATNDDGSQIDPPPAFDPEPHRFASLVNAANDAIEAWNATPTNTLARGALPAIKVLPGGLSPEGGAGEDEDPVEPEQPADPEETPAIFLDAALDGSNGEDHLVFGESGLGTVDGLAVHLYASLRRQDKGARMATRDQYNALVAVLDQNGFVGTRRWITEIGFPSEPLGNRNVPRKAASPARQCRRLTTAYLRFARQEEQPRSFIVHRLFDPPSAEEENRFGLARTDPADPTQVLRKQSYRELKQLAEPSGTHQRIRCQTA